METIGIIIGTSVLSTAIYLVRIATATKDHTLIMWSLFGGK